MHVYTDGASVNLTLNGATVASAATPKYGNVVFDKVPFAAGALTALSLDASGKPLGSFTVATPGTAASLRLTIDAPSTATGTGTAVVSDGEDVALVRAELLDASGRLATGSSALVTFAVDSGDGRLIGVHSGNPAGGALAFQPPSGPTVTAYHGLARAIVRSSVDRATSAHHRRLMRQIDVGRGGGERVAEVQEEAEAGAVAPIVLRASSPGFADATIEIPLTLDLAQLPLAVAARAAEANALRGEAF